jgi:hypothetical protein
MLCFLSVRKLKPDTFDEFREAWEPSPDEYPPGFRRAYHIKRLGDRDEVVSFGLADMTVEQFESFREEHREAEERRQEAMRPYVEGIVIDAVYEVVDEVTPPS